MLRFLLLTVEIETAELDMECSVSFHGALWCLHVCLVLSGVATRLVDLARGGFGCEYMGASRFILILFYFSRFIFPGLSPKNALS